MLIICKIDVFFTRNIIRTLSQEELANILDDIPLTIKPFVLCKLVLHHTLVWLLNSTMTVFL